MSYDDLPIEQLYTELVEHGITPELWFGDELALVSEDHPSATLYRAARDRADELTRYLAERSHS